MVKTLPASVSGQGRRIPSRGHDAGVEEIKDAPVLDVSVEGRPEEGGKTREKQRGRVRGTKKAAGSILLRTPTRPPKSGYPSRTLAPTKKTGPNLTSGSALKPA